MVVVGKCVDSEVDDNVGLLASTEDSVEDVVTWSVVCPVELDNDIFSAVVVDSVVDTTMKNMSYFKS